MASNTRVWSTPEQAEAAFYQAFEAGDLAAMMQVWDEAADICCIHPMGKALTGPAQVSEGWSGIFSSGQSLSFVLEPLHRQVQGDLAVSVLHEHIRVQGDKRPRPPMLATNVYRRRNGGWRIWLHHASPAVVEVSTDPAMSGRLH